MQRKANVIGQNVAKFRFQRGWTQEELVGKIQLAGYDMSRETLASIETQRRSVKDWQLEALADALGVSTDDLFPARKNRGRRGSR